MSIFDSTHHGAKKSTSIMSLSRMWLSKSRSFRWYTFSEPRQAEEPSNAKKAKTDSILAMETTETLTIYDPRELYFMSKMMRNFYWLDTFNHYLFKVNYVKELKNNPQSKQSYDKFIISRRTLPCYGTVFCQNIYFYSLAQGSEI